MNKIKTIWRNNKIFIVLVIILIICFFTICGVVITYFFGGSETVYGDRLNEINKHQISDKFQKEYINKLKSDEKVSNVVFKSKGRIIYIEIDFVPDTVLSEAQSKASESIAEFPEKIAEYYDINFTLRCKKSENSEGYVIMGAKNVSGTAVVWNNNTKVESEE